MQTAHPHHVVCDTTSQGQYVTGVTPPFVASYQPYNAATQLYTEMPQMPVFVAIGDNWFMPQSNAIYQPPPQQWQYLPIPPTPVNPPAAQFNQNGKQTSQAVLAEQVQGQTLPMADINQVLHPMEMRHILIPQRRSGQNRAVSQHPWLPGSVKSDLSLRESSVAIKRRSQSQDGSDATKCGLTGSGPVKRCATSLGETVTSQCSSDDSKGKISDSRFVQKMVDVLEYYFSDDCLSKNAYLLKQISQQENGFVSLRRIAALKRIKTLTRDLRAVAHCAKQSKKLELSKDEMMVRRIQPLPDSIEAPRFIRTVIAIHLPLNNPSIESVTSLFAPFGDLTQVRVLKPGKPLPSYLKDYTPWIPDLGQSPCALVEFESQDEAQKACREINMNNRRFNTLRVALLKPGARLRRTLYRKYKGEEKSESHSPLQSPDKSHVTTCDAAEAGIAKEQPTSETHATEHVPDSDARSSSSPSPNSTDEQAETVDQMQSTVPDKTFSQSGHVGVACNVDTETWRSKINISNSGSSVGTGMTTSPNPPRREWPRRPGSRTVRRIRDPIGPKDADEKGFPSGFRKSSG